MDAKFQSLIKQTEALEQGQDKEFALSALNVLQNEEESNRKLRVELIIEEQRKTGKRRLIALFTSLPFASALLYFVANAVMTGKSSITFQRNVDYVFWQNDPYIFLFVTGFVGLIGLVMLYLAFYQIITGRTP